MQWTGIGIFNRPHLPVSFLNWSLQQHRITAQPSCQYNIWYPNTGQVANGFRIEIPARLHNVLALLLLDVISFDYVAITQYIIFAQHKEWFSQDNLIQDEHWFLHYLY